MLPSAWINRLCHWWPIAPWLGCSTLHWRHNERDGISNRQPHDCLLNCLFRRWSNKTSKLHVTDLCVGNSPVTGEFPTQKASNAENVSIWWRHYIQGTVCIQGAFLGGIAGVCITVWVNIGSVLTGANRSPPRPLSVAGCSADNVTITSTMWTSTMTSTSHVMTTTAPTPAQDNG